MFGSDTGVRGEVDGTLVVIAFVGVFGGSDTVVRGSGRDGDGVVVGPFTPDAVGIGPVALAVAVGTALAVGGVVAFFTCGGGGGGIFAGELFAPDHGAVTPVGAFTTVPPVGAAVGGVIFEAAVDEGAVAEFIDFKETTLGLSLEDVSFIFSDGEAKDLL